MISLGKEFSISCGNSCRWGSPGGMATNGACHCFDKLTPQERVDLIAGIHVLREIAALPHVLKALQELVIRTKL